MRNLHCGCWRWRRHGKTQILSRATPVIIHKHLQPFRGSTRGWGGYLPNAQRALHLYRRPDFPFRKLTTCSRPLGLDGQSGRSRPFPVFHTSSVCELREKLYLWLKTHLLTFLYALLENSSSRILFGFQLRLHIFFWKHWEVGKTFKFLLFFSHVWYMI